MNEGRYKERNRNGHGQQHQGEQLPLMSGNKEDRGGHANTRGDTSRLHSEPLNIPKYCSYLGKNSEALSQIKAVSISLI